MPSSPLLKGDGDRSATAAERCGTAGRVHYASAGSSRLVLQRASRFVPGRHYCTSKAVQPVTERGHSRIRTPPAIEHGDVAARSSPVAAFVRDRVPMTKGA
jgi:hypothetical protein